MMADVQDQAIRQHCKALRMPTIGGQFARLADAATREGQTHIGYLEALLAAEMEECESRAIARLLHEARLPRMKTLDEFEFDRSGVAATHLRTLAEGEYVTRAEPILLVGEAGEGLGAVDLILTNPPFGTKKGGGRPARPDFTITADQQQAARFRRACGARAAPWRPRRHRSAGQRAVRRWRRKGATPLDDGRG